MRILLTAASSWQYFAEGRGMPLVTQRGGRWAMQHNSRQISREWKCAKGRGTGAAKNMWLNTYRGKEKHKDRKFKTGKTRWNDGVIGAAQYNVNIKWTHFNVKHQPLKFIKSQPTGEQVKSSCYFGICTGGTQIVSLLFKIKCLL